MSQYYNSGYPADQYGYSQTDQSGYYYGGETSQQVQYTAPATGGVSYPYTASVELDNSSMYDYTGSSHGNDMDDQAREQAQRQYEKHELEGNNRKRTDDFVDELSESYDKRYDRASEAVAAKQRQMARLIREQTGDKTYKESSRDPGHKSSRDARHKSSKDAGHRSSKDASHKSSRDSRRKK